MDKAEFRSWLGSDLATRQLAEALKPQEDREQCSACNWWMAADGSDHAGGEYGFDMVICRQCFREHVLNDKNIRTTVDLDRICMTAHSGHAEERPDPAFRRGECPVCKGDLVSNVYRIGGRGLIIVHECWNSLKANAGEINTCQYRRVL